jgi:hypothetical protein
MTDREWWDSLPQDAEFLPPPGECGGLFRSDNRGGLRCRPDVPQPDDPPCPDPERYGFVEFWASGALWVELSVLRTWERYVP